jgi:rSAM/selenodomain-associated transferase 1
MSRGATSAVLVVFARKPAPDRVKTRLAAAVGGERAAAIYEAFVADLATRLRTARLPVLWAIAPPVAGFAELFDLRSSDCFAQVGDDLGVRMHAAFREVRDRGFDRCALIGSDLPQLPIERIEAAFAALDGADLVLGPAADGGYYLIAMRAPHDVFSGMRWSHPGVLADTLAKAHGLGLRTRLLARDFDVDTPDDLEKLRALLARRPELRRDLPATAAILGVRAIGSGSVGRS